MIKQNKDIYICSKIAIIESNALKKNYCKKWLIIIAVYLLQYQ